MNRTKLPINEIIVEDRQRQDLGDIPELAQSLARFGLIQPIVISQDKRLLAGGRRLTAAVSLGWKDIDIVYKETLSASEAFEIELEENIRRKEMTWQEKCLNISKIHSLKRLAAAERGDKWTLEQTGALIGAVKATVHYCITLAKELQRSPDSPLWKEPTMKSAWDLILLHEQQTALEALKKAEAERASNVPHIAEQFIMPTLAEYGSVVEMPDPAAADLDKEDAREKYLRNPMNDPAKFDEYYASKKANEDAVKLTVPLSSRLIQADCIEFMRAHRGRFAHIITDIPYGIDMDNLDQDGSGMVDIDLVRNEHTVEGNLKLMEDFFPAAFDCLGETGFLATWCDLTGDPETNMKVTGHATLWEYMYRLATSAGFKVQRWPLTWNKLHRCGNQAAQYNYTKSTEHALICRKGNAVLMKPSGTSVVTASNDEIRRLIDHPFAKPFECWSFLADHIAYNGQLVLEPFAGKGSGVIGLLRAQLNVIGVEINQHHYNELVENVKKYYRKINPDFRFV